MGGRFAVAVVVPVYNAEGYLARCAASVLSQGDFVRLYLVDDGSVDGSGALADSIGEDPRVKVIHQANTGLVGAWKRGLLESREPYVSFLDADDWLEEGCLAMMEEKLPRDLDAGGAPLRREVVCAGYWLEKTDAGRREERLNPAAPGRYEGEALEEKIKKHLLGNEVRTLILSRCMKLIDRRLLLDNLSLVDGAVRMGEDVNTMFPVFLDAEAVTVVDRPVYHYRFVTSSMVHAYDPSIAEGVKRLYEALLRVCREKGREDLVASAEREYAYLSILAVKNEVRRGGKLPANVRSVRRLLEETGSAGIAEKIEAPANPADRVLYGVMRRPGFIRCLSAVVLFRVFDRLRGL